MPTGDSVAQGQLNIALAELKEVRAENERLRKQVKRLTARYAIPENTLLCVGFDGGCDGDLEGSPHELFCPARAEDIKLRPHLYDTARATEPEGEPHA